MTMTIRHHSLRYVVTTHATKRIVDFTPPGKCGEHMAIEVVASEITLHRGITITFSDGTFAYYVAADLIEIRPNRDITQALQRAMLLRTAREA